MATVAKAVEPGAFAEQIRLEGLDSLLPVTWMVLLALALEAGLGTFLLLGLRRLWVLLPAAGLVGFFVFLTGRNYWLVSQGLRSKEAACGCFGSLLERTPAEAFWQDLLLLVPALLLAFLGRGSASVALPWLRLAISTMVVGLVVGFAGTRPDLYFSGLAADIAGESAGEGERFIRTRDYQLLQGTEVLEADIYHSAESVTFLVLSPRLSSPVVLRVRTETVQTLGSERIRFSGEESLTLSPDTVFRKEGEFAVDSEGISFAVEGLRLRLRSGEETTAAIRHNPEVSLSGSRSRVRYNGKSGWRESVFNTCLSVAVPARSGERRNS